MIVDSIPPDWYSYSQTFRCAVVVANQSGLAIPITSIPPIRIKVFENIIGIQVKDDLMSQNVSISVFTGEFESRYHCHF